MSKRCTTPHSSCNSSSSTRSSILSSNSSRDGSSRHTSSTSGSSDNDSCNSQQTPRRKGVSKPAPPPPTLEVQSTKKNGNARSSESSMNKSGRQRSVTAFLNKLFRYVVDIWQTKNSYAAKQFFIFSCCLNFVRISFIPFFCDMSFVNFRMVSETITNDLIHWSSDGKSFIGIYLYFLHILASVSLHVWLLKIDALRFFFSLVFSGFFFLWSTCSWTSRKFLQNITSSILQTQYVRVLCSTTQYVQLSQSTTRRTTNADNRYNERYLGIQ
jgi:hypothetical protein